MKLVAPAIVDNDIEYDIGLSGSVVWVLGKLIYIYIYIDRERERERERVPILLFFHHCL